MGLSKVIWLASWYPNKLSPYNGDFIKRHAEAVSIFVSIHLLTIVRDEHGRITRNVHVDYSTRKNLRETIIYYRSMRTGIRVMDKILSAIKFRRLLKKHSKKIMVEEKPELVHVHVGLNMGIIAGFLRRKFKVPYIVTEHWTGLLEEAVDNFSDLSLLKKKLWKEIIINADRCTAVSNHLAQALARRFSVGSDIVPNVVDTAIFKPGILAEENKLRFIFISTFDDFKNPDFVLQAFKLLARQWPEARLTIFAPRRDIVEEKCRQLAIEAIVDCHNEVPQTELARYIQESNALILYSSYETFGCVVIEANACGVPVIVSDIPAMAELVKDGRNGLLVPPFSSEYLALAMKRFVEMKLSFDRDKIVSDTIERFEYEKVGCQFADLYKNVIEKNRN